MTPQEVNDVAWRKYTMDADFHAKVEMVVQTMWSEKLRCVGMDMDEGEKGIARIAASMALIRESM